MLVPRTTLRSFSFALTSGIIGSRILLILEIIGLGDELGGVFVALLLVVLLELPELLELLALPVPPEFWLLVDVGADTTVSVRVLVCSSLPRLSVDP